MSARAVKDWNHIEVRWKILAKNGVRFDVGLELREEALASWVLAGKSIPRREGRAIPREVPTPDGELAILVLVERTMLSYNGATRKYVCDSIVPIDVQTVGRHSNQ